ncbi:acetyl-CoA carboxylase carboxyltransferase component [Nocardioides luteus]|uniref:Carboxyl transferase/pyruvate carboxylase n=1 Tax=Nocardioides luteus TaxID=1844 RepID=A0ABQ5SZS8_9ACTN|nr:carboxyl transferase domain-containing protein [Nocardioides luteus]MDR7310531.1 acetyl-CoA carboxylase carboxyltransferase component [Nocardioides luteus]GGR42208.1 putative carboxyl transferase/pyruvate carboxylase [Nocardioides luteus]GLJ69688.1 putative carboxyl transferase/pyruvate carboxylase [Nocardioides luteus]
MTDDAPATGLTELHARRFLTTDAARPEKVARWHAKGRRTARENIADLVDPGSFVEYGRFITAAQEGRRDLADLVVETPADGIIGGTATIAGKPCAVLSYDYLVMAGTQGMRGHRKSDRLLETVKRMRLPTVFFTEGGGGRPGDTDIPLVSALDVESFALWGELEGVVPRIAVVSGRCFAGNAVLAGCADLRIATPDANLGMAGPAMIAGGGLGTFAPEEIGPVSDHIANGVIDILVDDEAAAVAAVRDLFSCLETPAESGDAVDQDELRSLLPDNDREGFDVRPVVESLADTDSVTWLREGFAPELVTALARIDGIPVGVIANQSTHLAGALTSDASVKGADFLALCGRWDLPVVSLVDTPGFMVGPDAERTGLVRHASRMVVAGAQLSTPLVGVILRRGYGLGAQAMLGGSTHRPLITVAWPDAHLGPMGLEGAVRLSMAGELAALPEDEREERVAALTEEYRKQASALNAARMHEIDDVIDPAETRAVIAATLRRA